MPEDDELRSSPRQEAGFNRDDESVSELGEDERGEDEREEGDRDVDGPSLGDGAVGTERVPHNPGNEVEIFMYLIFGYV